MSQTIDVTTIHLSVEEPERDYEDDFIKDLQITIKGAGDKKLGAIHAYMINRNPHIVKGGFHAWMDEPTEVKERTVLLFSVTRR